MHTRGSQLVPELLLKFSYTLHIQYRYIEHVLEEMSCKKNKKKLLAKWLLIYNLVILYDMCIDSAYAGNSTCTTACAETIQYFAYTI